MEDYNQCCILGCNAVQSSRGSPRFQRKCFPLLDWTSGQATIKKLAASRVLLKSTTSSVLPTG
jgi:hypothetical protein